MKNLKEALGASGFDPAYADIALYALKRGRNGDGRPFEVGVVARSTGANLGAIVLCGDESGAVTEAVDAGVDLEFQAEVLGQSVADIIVDKLADQHRRAQDGSPNVYTSV